MQQAGEYPGPGPDDYTNVEALNLAFIRATSDMKGPQRGRLAVSPFLLFSMREQELDWWDDALSDRRQADLLEPRQLDSPELRQIQFAALSFVWHLVRRNPYAVRIISGASVAWCERVSELPVVTLLDRIGARGDLMQSRLDSAASLADRLLSDGTSSMKNVRRSSQFAVWQTLLTREGFDNDSRLPAAACRLSAPAKVLNKKL